MTVLLVLDCKSSQLSRTGSSGSILVSAKVLESPNPLIAPHVCILDDAHTFTPL